MLTALRDLQRFGRCDGGGIAILFGVSSVVLFGMVGLAVDLSRAHSAKSALQQDVDATVLHVAAERLKGAPNFDATAVSTAYMNGLHRAKQGDGPLTISVVESSESRIELSAEVKVPTLVAKILGVGPMTVAASAEAEIGRAPVEVVLALDNTTSMDGAKLAALKDAAKMLVEAAFRAPEAEQSIKIGIVPFGEYVNVGLDKRGSAWLDVEDDDVSGSKTFCDWQPKAAMSPNTCQPFTSTYKLDGVSHAAAGENCEFNYDGAAFRCNATKENVWRGCVGSRDYPLEMSDADYGRKIPGLMNVWCTQEITPLSSDKEALKADIESMWANGNTYIPAGLIWGWRVLSNIEPFGDAGDYNAKVNGKQLRKILVVMTDGENSNSPAYPWHSSTNVGEANKLTAETCAGIKGAGIEIFTVAFDVNDDVIKGVLEGCATSPSNYFDAMGSTQLSSAFEAIARDFSPLHLSR